MDDILKELELAFKMISTIPVTGDSVDTMAAARVKLRNAYNKLSEMKISTSAEPVDDSVEV